MQWRSGAVAQWRSGAVAQWRSGAVAQWRSGAVAQWRSGAVTRTSDYRRRVRGHFFTVHRSNSLSYMNAYRAVDSGGYLCTNNLSALIAA